jgi:putative ABC transport system permease protein
MALMDGYRRLLQGIGRRSARDARDEIELHLRLTTDELIAGGMSPDAAEVEAQGRFGNTERVAGELCRVQHQIRRREGVWTLLGRVAGDVRFALRALRRRPGVAVFVIGTLALGIGGATAIFSVANGMFLKPIPGVRDNSRMVEFTQYDDGGFNSISYPILKALGDGVDELAHVAGFELLTVAVGDGDDVPMVTMGLHVTEAYSETLGTRPAVGRLLGPTDGSHPDPSSVAVISHSLWQRRFAGDPAIVGRTVRFNRAPPRVIGVTEPGFRGHAVAMQLDVFVPIGAAVPSVLGPSSLDHHRSGQLDVIARLAPGATLQQAGAAADALSDQYVQALEGPKASYPLRAIPYGGVPGMVRTPLAAFLGILLLVVTLVLGITCVKITNLQLSRAAQCGREIAVRMSLGASKGRIIGQLLIESAVIFVFGAALGTLLASWAVALASSYKPSIPLPGARIALDLSVDYRVLGFALGLTVLTGLFSGLVPGWHAARRIQLDQRPAPGARVAGRCTGCRNGRTTGGRGFVPALVSGLAAR